MPGSVKEDVEGIAELGDDAVVGEDPIKYLGLDDEVIDFDGELIINLNKVIVIIIEAIFLIPSNEV